MTRFLKCTLAILIATGATALVRAADAPAEPEKRPVRPAVQQMTPEQREAQRKVWRERMQKTVDELKKKKTDGTITEQEAKRLESMEKWLQRMEQGPQPATPAKPGDKPAEKPAEKPVEKK